MVDRRQVCGDWSFASGSWIVTTCCAAPTAERPDCLIWDFHACSRDVCLDRIFRRTGAGLIDTGWLVW